MSEARRQAQIVRRWRRLPLVTIVVSLWLFLGSRDLFTDFPFGVFLHVPFSFIVAYLIFRSRAPSESAGRWLLFAVGLFLISLPLALGGYIGSTVLSDRAAEKALEMFLASAAAGDHPSRFMVELEAGGDRAATSFYADAVGTHRIAVRDSEFWWHEFVVTFESGSAFYFELQRANLWDRWRVRIAKSDWIERNGT